MDAQRAIQCSCRVEGYDVTKRWWTRWYRADWGCKRCDQKSILLYHNLAADKVRIDTPIGYSTFILQRREDIYPAASEKFAHYLEFSPDRWDQWTPKSWTYIPFNGGPRICIGQQFALTEMAYTVVRILQTFERIECKQEEPPQFRSDIVLQPAMGVHIGFYKRQ